MVSAIVHTARHVWLPTGDIAAMWLRVRDVGGPHTPPVGPHSRLAAITRGQIYYLCATALILAALTAVLSFGWGDRVIDP